MKNQFFKLLIVLSILITQTVSYAGEKQGGGGYVSENSILLISELTKELAKQIRSSNPKMYVNMPKNLNQFQLAEVIEKLRLEPQKNVERDGKLLMFNFGVDEKGPYLEALEPFFVVYASEPVKFGDYFDFANNLKYKDLRLKVLHEAGHLLELNEEQAEKFGMDLLTALYFDRTHCISSKLVDFPVNHDVTVPSLWFGINIGEYKNETLKAKRLEFVIYRGYSRVMQIVDGSTAINENDGPPGMRREWLSGVGADIILKSGENNPGDIGGQLWMTSAEFSKWDLARYGKSYVEYKTDNPPLWEGQDSLLLAQLADGKLVARYTYSAKRLRQHDDATNLFVPLPTSGVIGLKCTESYKTLEFDK